MRILLGIDHVTTSAQGPKLAMEQAKAFNGSVFAVSCVMFSEQTLEFQTENAKKNLQAVKDLFDREGVACTTELITQSMDPGEALVQFAEAHEIDLVIIGFRSKSRVGKLLLGSTAQYVILNSPCPVLTYHEHEGLKGDVRHRTFFDKY
jgi:nucleotide-binding universal stress UspA family protein